MQYSFLRKFGYSTLAFGLLAASVGSESVRVRLEVYVRVLVPCARVWTCLYSFR